MESGHVGPWVGASESESESESESDVRVRVRTALGTRREGGEEGGPRASRGCAPTPGVRSLTLAGRRRIPSL